MFLLLPIILKDRLIKQLFSLVCTKEDSPFGSNDEVSVGKTLDRPAAHNYFFTSDVVDLPMQELCNILYSSTEYLPLSKATGDDSG